MPLGMPTSGRIDDLLLAAAAERLRAAKAVFFSSLTASLKRCPDTNLIELKFARQIFEQTAAEIDG
jgi:hypothetical protein